MANKPKKQKKPELPDLTEIFDLNRHKAVADYVERFENLMADREAIQADIKQLASDAKKDAFSKLEIQAMKKIAKWRRDAKANDAAAMLAALKRVANAVKMPLFSWADRDAKE